MLRKLFTPRVKLFQLDPRYFPEATQSLIPAEAVLRHGILPLGFKGQKLNVGFLDPDSAPDRSAAVEILKKRPIQRFRIRAEQLIELLDARYGIPRSAILDAKRTDVHPEIHRVLSELVDPPSFGR
jgi:hypothetical protein